MANTAYARQQIGLYLKEFRINSYDPSLRTQSGLGSVLDITQKQVSLIECGLTEAPVQLAARWCKETEWFEGCDLLSHIYGLDPFGFVPVDPGLNQNVSEALHNLKRQLKQALEAVDKLIEEEPGTNIAIRHGTYTLTSELKECIKEVADLIPAVKTYFYASERQDRAHMREIGSMWNIEALDDRVAMPGIENFASTTLALR